MGSYNKSQLEFSEDTTLRALAFELKNPLIAIARRAELDGGTQSMIIQYEAQQALQLIDSFLLTAQMEYGQLGLPLEPTGIGSVLYDTAHQLRYQAQHYNTEIIIDDRIHDPIMTHKPALKSVLIAFSNILIKLESSSKRRRQIFMKSYKTRQGKIGVSILRESDINLSDIRRGLDLKGSAHMPLSQTSGSTQASLSIAESLCKSLGGTLYVKHSGKLSGLATELPRSEQLALV